MNSSGARPYGRRPIRCVPKKCHIIRRPFGKSDADSRPGLAMRRIPSLRDVERRHILNTLRLCGNNRTRAAKLLGLSIRCLRIELHQYEGQGFSISASPAGKHASGKAGENNGDGVGPTTGEAAPLTSEDRSATGRRSVDRAAGCAPPGGNRLSGGSVAPDPHVRGDLKCR
jgi:hypothetical protein